MVCPGCFIISTQWCKRAPLADIPTIIPPMNRKKVGDEHRNFGA